MLGRLGLALVVLILLAVPAPAAARHRMTLEEKVGQLFMTYGYGQTVADPDPAMVAGNRNDHGVDTIEQLIRRYHLGGVIYFAETGNLPSPQRIAGLSNGIQRVATSSGARVPALISADQEHGVVVRMTEPATQFPGNMALGAARDPRLARLAGAITAEELRAVGINQNIAPVADVLVNPENSVIGVRSFSSDPHLTGALTAAWVRGTRSHDVAATAKHFPGHGDAIEDSETNFPVLDHTRAQVEAIDLPPFRAAIDAGVPAILTAHIVARALDPSGRPTTFSRPILTGLLRNRLGFDGVIVADALLLPGPQRLFGDARAAIEAIKAGSDVLLIPQRIGVAYDAVLNAVRSGEISERRIDESVQRILRLKRRLGVLDRPFVDEGEVASTVGAPEHLADAEVIAARTTTLVANDAGTVPLKAGTGARLLVTGATATATLAAEISKRGVSAQAFETGAAPTEEQIAEAARRAAAGDAVVVLTAGASASPQQQRLVAALTAAGKPVVVVAVDTPYDIAHLPDVRTYLATYGSRAVSLRALTRVLFGEVRPRGRLPVDIAAPGDPSTILFPFGHGLS